MPLRTRGLRLAIALFVLACAARTASAAEPYLYDADFQALECASQAYGIALGDLDGNGALDVVVAQYGSVGIFLGAGDGTFAPRIDFGYTGDTRDVALADFNGDGKLDIVTVAATGELTLLLNNGSGTFLPPITTNTGVIPTAVAAGKIDGDSLPDIVVASTTGTLVYLQTGPGVLGPPTTLPGSAQDVAIADLNADGKSDIALATTGATIFLGNGDGTFGAGQLVFNGAAAMFSIATGNFNADTLPDLVISRAGGSSWFIANLVNGGSGTFSVGPSPFTTSANQFPFAVAGDFTGDGLDDIFSTSPLSVRVYPRAADGTFGSVLFTGSGWGYPGSAAVGDLNGDGKLDAVAASYGDIVCVHFGNGNGTFGPRRNYASNFALAGVGDFTGDGHVDVLLDNGSVLPGLGNGGLGAPILNAGLSVGSSAVHDFDGDGKLDVATLRSGGLQFLKGNGGGTFTAGPLGPSNNASALAMADLNGDGIPDLASSNGGSGVSAYLGHGDGTFTRLDQAVAGQCLNIVIGDWNGDGKNDLASNDYNAGLMRIFLGHGDGTFDAPIVMATHATPNFLAAGDLNGDGRTDITATHEDGTVTVFLSLGDGTFAQTLYPGSDTGHAESLGIQMADLNDDGFLDAAVCDGFNTNSIMVFPGNGTGALGAPSHFGAIASPRFLMLADLNEDGEPDMVCYSSLASQLAILMHRPPQAVPALFAVSKASALADRVELAWYASAEPGTPVTVSRTTGVGGTWAQIGTTVVDGSHSVSFVDHTVTAGAHYGYALSIDGRLGGEVFVDVPTAATLAFLGARPNPARGNFMLAIQLRNGEPALLEVFSVDGRRLLSQRVTNEAAGEHLVKLGRTLPTGVQVVRITQGGQSVSGRVAVLP